MATPPETTAPASHGTVVEAKPAAAGLGEAKVEEEEVAAAAAAAAPEAKNGEAEAAEAVGGGADGKVGEGEVELAEEDGKGRSLSAAEASNGEEPAAAGPEAKNGEVEAAEAAGDGADGKVGEGDVELAEEDGKGRRLSAEAINGEESAVAAGDGEDGEVGEGEVELGEQDGRVQNFDVPEVKKDEEAAVALQNGKGGNLESSVAKADDDAVAEGQNNGELPAQDETDGRRHDGERMAPNGEDGSHYDGELATQDEKDGNFVAAEAVPEDKLGREEDSLLSQDALDGKVEDELGKKDDRDAPLEEKEKDMEAAGVLAEEEELADKNDAQVAANDELASKEQVSAMSMDAVAPSEKTNGNLGDKVEVSARSIEAAVPEVVLEAETNGELDAKMEVSPDMLVAGGEPPEDSSKQFEIWYKAAMPELASDECSVSNEPAQSNFVANGGDTSEDANNCDAPSQNVGLRNEEKHPFVSAAEVLGESSGKGQVAEGQLVTSEAVKDVHGEKADELESVGADAGNAVLAREVALAPAAGNELEEEKSGAGEVVEESNKEQVVSEEKDGAGVAVEESHKVQAVSEEKDGAGEVVEESNKEQEVYSVVEQEGKTGGDEEVVVAEDDDEDGGCGNEDEEDVDGVSSDRSPARVAILESSEAAKQIMKELEEASSSGSAVSGLSSSRDYTNSMDGQIVLDDSDGDEDDYEDNDGDEKGLDSAALAALLKAATGASPTGNITVTSQDGSKIFSMDRPAGLGSSIPSLRPTAPRPTSRSNLFGSSELAVTADPTEEMTEEEKKLHGNVELIRVKFLRLVYRMGATPEETVASQVLYRLSLAEGIRRGRQANRAFSLENARKKALQLEVEGKDDLSFSCNILVLGKTGVGKSATINSIFGEEKSKTDAFGAATTKVREVVGNVDGVQIRIIDTPGLQTNVLDQGFNKKILAAVKKYTKKCPPDIVLYVDRLDSQSRDLNDLPLLRTITATLGSSIWFNAIVALTHAASAPPDGSNGAPMTYEVLMAQRSHIIQQSIRQAAGDMRLMNPVALVENHPSCRRNREGQKVLPNGQTWRQQMLLLCYSSKILSEANSLLKLQDPSPGKLFGFRFRSPPLPFLLSSLLQSRAHPKLSADQGGEEGDSDIDLDDYSDVEQDDDEEEYDQLPPFKPLTKAQLERLTKDQKNAYFDEYDYRVKLLQKKQWKDEIRRLKEMKKRGKAEQDAFGYGNMAGEIDQDPPPENVSVPLPDMVLPPSFDCDNPTYRYRFLEPTSTMLARPVLDTHGWDHDCGYDGVSLEETLAIINKFPASVSVQVTKDKKEFSIHLDSSISAKHGESASSLAGFDIQTVGRQLAYILRGETKFKNIKKNKTTGGFSVTFLGDIVATGVKIEDQLSVGKRLALVASTGAMRAQGDTAYGANLEARLKDKDYPIGQSLSTLGLSLMKWRGDLALGANLQSQFSVGRGSKIALRFGLNNKLSGQITVRTSTSEQVHIALLGLIPLAASLYKILRPGEQSFAY